MYDARGHGASEPAGSYGYDGLAADLLSVLDDRGIDRAVLAGASMGAHTIARFALEHPERAAALVLITPAFDPDAPGRGFDRWDALSRGAARAAAWTASSRPTASRACRSRSGTRCGPCCGSGCRRTSTRTRSPTRCERCRARAPFESWEELARLRLPVTVVASRDEADPEHPFATGERYARAIPGARLVTEEPGKSPLAWQGGQLSRVIAETAARA